jgi:hypothetical protein
MRGFDVSELRDGERQAGVWAAAVLHAVAREEVAGRRRAALTEARLETWERFRGRLSSTDLVTLLLEDAAVLHPVPFDPGAVGSPFQPARLPEELTDAWLKAVGGLPLNQVGTEYILDQARLLGLPTRMARSELHVVKAHQRVLELPGTGGQLAHHLVHGQGDITLQDNMLVACSTWQELTLAGIVAVELGAPHADFAVRVEPADLRNPSHPIRQRSFDFVVGLHPDKGGLFQVDDQLAIWFPTARILLV